MSTSAEREQVRRAFAAISLAVTCCLVLPMGHAAAQQPPRAETGETPPAGDPAPAVTDALPAETPAAPAEEAAPAEPPAQDPATLTKAELASRVQAIFAARCFACHTETQPAGGLLLTTEEDVRLGGDSGKPLLDLPLADNELYARISSSERTYRMPKDSDPLPDEEIETIRRWIEQGAPWPMVASAAEKSWWAKGVDEAADLVERFAPEYHYALPYIVAFLLLLLVLLAILRMGAAARQDPERARGRLGSLYRRSASIRPRELVLVLLLAGSGVVLAFARGHILKIDQERAKLLAMSPQSRNAWDDTVYGFPPKPIRPRHEQGVTRTYYRGNCERNSELFNGGNYLTAVFHANLCNARHEPIEIGEALASDEEVFLRWEIERAPGTTEELFSEELMASVLLTNGYPFADQDFAGATARLETLDPGWRWVGFVPLGKPQDKLDGVIYMYSGIHRRRRLAGIPSYAVEYHLRFAGGKLLEDSDLWMDSFGNGAFAPPDPAHLLPYSEWFDFRPMPLITGQNTQDPKLLGIDEHVEKGLIKPRVAEPPADEEPAVEKPAEPSPAEEPSANDPT